ncbi:MAG: BrnA antitoxin family protein, partial [Pararhodobacter sp.]
LRLDPEVLSFFRAQGRGYQTRINAVLRAYMEAQRR